MRFLLILVPFLLTACSDNILSTKRDPLKGEPAYIRNAKPKNQKPVEETPFVPQDALIVTMEPGIANFTEGAESKIKFKGELKNISEPLELEIETLPKGASFDPVSGIFTWTPSQAFVPGTEYFETIVLNVTLRTLGTSGMQVTEPFNLNVFRSVKVGMPTVLPVTDLVPTLFERRTTLFTVTVKDTDAADATAALESKFPRLVVVPGGKSKDASGFVRFEDPNPTQDPNNPEMWTFRMSMDFTNQELTMKDREMEFGLRASSAFGVPSVPTLVKIKAITDASPPVSTMSGGKFTAVVGQLNTFFFTLYTARGDGALDVSDFLNGTGFNGLNGQKKMTCLDGPTGYMVIPTKNCKLQWIPGGVLGNTDTTFKLKNLHFDPTVAAAEATIKNTFSAVNPTVPPAFVE